MTRIANLLKLLPTGPVFMTDQIGSRYWVAQWWRYVGSLQLYNTVTSASRQTKTRTPLVRFIDRA
jgi:hypothetical protein